MVFLWKWTKCLSLRKCWDTMKKPARLDSQGVHTLCVCEPEATIFTAVSIQSAETKGPYLPNATLIQEIRWNKALIYIINWVPWKPTVGRCISYWNSPFLTDMLIFGGVLGGGNSNIVLFTPNPGVSWSNLTSIFYQMGWKKPPPRDLVKGLLRDHKLFINCLQGGRKFPGSVWLRGPRCFWIPMMLGCWVNFR